MFSFREFKQSYQKFWSGYISFKERTNRKDYWLAMLGHGVLTLCLLVLAGLFNLLSNDVLPDIWSVFSYFFIGLWGLYSLVATLPFCAIAVRRLRDAGLPWELIFILIAPFGGFLSILILNALPSSKSQVGIPEFSQPVYRIPKIQETGHESFFQAIKNYFLGYVSFRGRSSRISFWMIQLVFVALFAVLGLLFVGTQLFENIFFGHAFLATWLLLFINFLIALGLFLPTLALFARRFRDAGLSNFGIVLFFFSAASLFLLRNIIHTVDVASFGIRDFSLLNYLLFLVNFVFVACLIFVAVQDKNQLAQKEKTLLFRRKG
ncbi:DUF805 domain-containing protein [Lactococcus ileimucosae]|uniref:DUF805 domain-containing protein n=1 Tax=Lactococcus ileimucosae TaxID=2941329 RepID=UPI0035138A86